MRRSSRFEFSHPDIPIDRSRLAAIIAAADAAKAAGAAKHMHLLIETDNGRIAPRQDPIDVQAHTDALLADQRDAEARIAKMELARRCVRYAQERGVRIDGMERWERRPSHSKFAELR